MTDPAKNLTAAIADLEQLKVDLDAAIANMRNVLVTVYGAGSLRSSITVTNGPAEGRQQRARSILGRAEKVRTVFDSSPGRPWDAESLLAEIGEDVHEGSIKGVHAIFSRLSRAGEIEKVARGIYRSTNTSAPVAPGAEDDGESASDSPVEEGGTENDSAPPVGRDDHAFAAHDPHGHGVRRAAIGGSMSDVTPSVQS